MDERSAAERLREARDRAGWTQRRLAVALDVTTETVSRWERGQTCPSVDDYEAALRALTGAGKRVAG